MWLVFTILTTLFWGVAEVFYKLGAERKTKYTHLRTAIFIGIAMGIHAFVVLVIKKVEFHPINLIYYFPVFFLYMMSMVLASYGVRFIENSVSSVVEEFSSVITAALCFFILGERIGGIAGFAMVLLTVGVVLLAAFETRDENDIPKDVTKKMLIVGFIMALSYALLDGVGTFLDVFYLDIEISPLKFVTESNIEDVANIAYELSFLITAIILFIFLKIKKEKIIFKEEKYRILTGVFETLGQAFYVYSFSGNDIVAVSIMSFMSVISVILSRIFLKEKLTKKQYFAVIMALIGVVILGIVGE
jgi:drug/metabolite transporter (DMT)-like permease